MEIKVDSELLREYATRLGKKVGLSRKDAFIY